MHAGHAPEVGSRADSHPVHSRSRQKPTGGNVINTNNYIAANVRQVGLLEMARKRLNPYSAPKVGEEVDFREMFERGEQEHIAIAIAWLRSIPVKCSSVPDDIPKS